MTGGEEWYVISQKGCPRHHPLQPDDEGGDVVIYSPPNKSANQITHPPRWSIGPVQPFVLILVGIPGSGKSTFACRLEEVSVPFSGCHLSNFGLQILVHCYFFTASSIEICARESGLHWQSKCLRGPRPPRPSPK
ncbi:hypothetical protein ACHAWX_000432 [Stephanocyclus meneghinianus]